EPDVQGWTFADGDGAELSAAMVMAYERRRELTRLGGEARRRAESRANWKANFPSLLRAYAMAVGEAA
ncbi:MAG: glycosyltransferase, partial [Anaerolineales bacterium]